MKLSKPKNDRISAVFESIVPDQYRGTDRFLDIITWNLRWFTSRDIKRVDRVTAIMDALNADIFVCQEIECGSLDAIAERLSNNGAGHYKVAYGTTGGDQRIAMMYDMDWIRAKSDIVELFGKDQVLTSDGKNAFPRLPLYAYFTGLSHESDPFDFQLLGVHLKSQRDDNATNGKNEGDGGKAQRELAAKKLAEWLTKEAPKIDADALIIGDWNAPISASVWNPLKALDKKNKIKFEGLNKSNEISYLMYQNASSLGSRIDLEATTVSAYKEMASDPEVVKWREFNRLLSEKTAAAKLKEYINEVRNTISDHMPVLTRFYWEQK